MNDRTNPEIPAGLDNDECARRLTVLADGTRLGALRALLAGPLHVWEIRRALDAEIDQSLLSHHLKVLRDAGLVSSERDGRSVLYRLSPEVSRDSGDRQLDLGCCALAFPRRAS